MVGGGRITAYRIPVISGPEKKKKQIEPVRIPAPSTPIRAGRHHTHIHTEYAQ